MVKHPVLQSGFVACELINVTRPDPFESENPRAPLFERPDQRHTEHFYSPEVTKMYHEMTVDRNFFNDFENREKVISLAFRGFGTTFFGDWVDDQKKFGIIEQQHMDFLMDTARFTCGIPRRLHLMTWLRLIGINVRSDNLYFDITKDLSGDDLKRVTSQNASMEEMIHRWVSQPEGYVDLMLTLQVVYGSRDPKSNLTAK